jgi:large subunit ribosomal protein L31e
MPAESYMVPLKRAYDKPRTRRSNVAVKEIFDFLWKHTRKRKEDIVLSKEVNEFVWKRGIQKPPRKIPISIKIEKDKVYVFLKDSAEIAKFLNKDKKVKAKKSIKETVMDLKDNMQNPTASKKDSISKIETKKTKKVETKKETPKVSTKPVLEEFVKEEKTSDKKEVVKKIK